jgi:hypothetical protein
VSVDLQDAEVAMFFGDGFVIAQGGTVIAAKEPHEFILFEERTGLFVYPFIQQTAAFVDLFEGFAHEAVLLEDLVLGTEIDIEFRFFAEVVGFHEDLFVRLAHVEPFTPGVAGFGVIEVHLHRRAEDVFTCPAGAGAVADGNFPGYREDNEAGFLFGEWEAEDIVLWIAWPAGVEF